METKMQPQPPKHGTISVTSLKRAHARKHVKEMTTSMNEVADYGGHGTGYSSQGGMCQGGASDADYQTTSVGAGDADSGGASDY